MPLPVCDFADSDESDEECRVFAEVTNFAGHQNKRSRSVSKSPSPNPAKKPRQSVTPPKGELDDDCKLTSVSRTSDPFWPKTQTQAGFKFLVTGNWALGHIENDVDQLQHFGQIIDEIGKLAVEQNIDVILFSGGMFSNSSPDGKTMLYACHKLRKIISRKIVADPFKTVKTPSGEPPWLVKCVLLNSFKIRLSRHRQTFRETKFSAYRHLSQLPNQRHWFV